MKYLNIIKRETRIMIIVVIILLVVVLGVSYAMFMQVTDNTNNQVVTTGTLQVEYASSNGYIENETYKELIPMSNDQGLLQTGYEFSVKNTGTLPVTYQVFMYVNYEGFNEDKAAGKITGDIFEQTELIKFNLQKNDDGNKTVNKLSEHKIFKDGEIQKYVLSETTLENENDIDNYKLRIWLDEDVDLTNIGKYVYLKVEVSSYITGQEQELSSIVKAYTYNQTSGASNYCVTGEEETCQETTCYESTDANSCASGTIVDYKVNDSDTVRFHVMYDNGNTMTMQTQKNTVYNVAWYGTEQDYTNANGPMTILPVLEEKTTGWTNVNPQTYTMGTTVFKTNGYTGCSSYNSCDANTYTLDERVANARMITVQEAADLGCTSEQKSCPIWMYNYLHNSTNYSGNTNDRIVENEADGNYGFWLGSASSLNDNRGWYIGDSGLIYRSNTYDINLGARAVVEINK